MKKDASDPQQQIQDIENPDHAKSDITNEDISRRAHAIYEQRGGFPGAELDDWLQAERELREQSGNKTDRAA
jgi:hypothetical protein